MFEDDNFSRNTKPENKASNKVSNKASTKMDDTQKLKLTVTQSPTNLPKNPSQPLIPNELTRDSREVLGGAGGSIKSMKLKKISKNTSKSKMSQSLGFGQSKHSKPQALSIRSSQNSRLRKNATGAKNTGSKRSSNAAPPTSSNNPVLASSAAVDCRGQDLPTFNEPVPGDAA